MGAPRSKDLVTFMAVTTVPDALPANTTPPGPPGPVLPGPGAGRAVRVSATLAAHEALTRKRRAGEPVLPLAFGEAGLPVHPELLAALAAVTGGNSYGPVAGRPRLREAAAGFLDPGGPPPPPGAPGARAGGQPPPGRPAAAPGARGAHA